MDQIKLSCILLFVLIYGGCVSDNPQYPNEINIPNCKQVEQNQGVVQVVITGTAGEFPRYTYLNSSKKLMRNKKTVNNWGFLPLPGNQGFIISSSGENDLPLETLIIAEAQDIGVCQKVRAIGALELHKAAHHETIIIAIPDDPRQQLIQASTFLDFMLDHDAIKYMIQSWYVNYKGSDAYDQVMWRNEQFASSLIHQGIKAASDD